MKRIPVTIQLREPLVISATNATAGLYRSLDFIPGSALLGAISARLYRNLKQKGMAYEVFHSGRVRFSNVLPEGAYPAPLSLFKAKSRTAVPLINRLFGDETAGMQLKQLRTGYVKTAENPETLTHIQPVKQLKLRTAIQAETGRAKESQLYSYQAISPALTWTGYIDCDDAELAEQLHRQLATLKTLRLGRSRSAHYGTVDFEVGKPKSPSAPTLPKVSINGQDHLVLWLASDLMVYDDCGTPSTLPTLRTLGLAEDDQSPIMQFVSVRHYAPYNAFRGRYDLSRQVITAGSILTWPITEEVLQTLDAQTLQRGLGAHREQGLGQLVPPNEVTRILGQKRIALEQAEEAASRPSSSDSEVTLPLIRWLTTRRNERQCRTELESWIDSYLMENVEKLYKQARRQALVPPYGPRPTQWNRLRDFAERTPEQNLTFEQIFERLRQDGQPWHRAEINQNTQDRVGSVQDGWHLEVRPGETFEQAFSKLLLDGGKKRGSKCWENGLFVLRVIAHRMASDQRIRDLAEGVVK